MKRVWGFVRPHLPVMSLQIFIKFAATVIELFLPWMLSTILDDAVPSGDMNAVFLWGALMVLCSALALVGNIVANRMSTKISRDITERLRHDLFERVSALSCAQTDRFTIPSLISRLTSDTYNVHTMIDRMQRLGIRAPIILLGGIFVSLTLEPMLTLVLVGTLPLLSLVVWYVSKRGIPRYTETQVAFDQLVRKVQENMTGVRVIKALSKTEYEKERFDEANRRLIRKDQRAGNLMAITNPAMNVLLNVGLSLVIVVGAFRVDAGVSQPGTIIAFLSYFALILNALMMVSRLFMMYSKGAASARRIAEVLDAPDTMATAERDHEDGEDHIVFRHVDFSYNKIQNNLSDVSFALKRGQTLGVIGPTGSGKTTLLQLLLRFYDPDRGEIRIDGDRLDGMPTEVLHTKFGVVFQNDFLFADTIRENIDFGRALGDEQIVAAAKTAQADFIAERPEGLDHVLTVKGANLSGGQKQRLLIARALAAHPEILLLDDCSSALDYKTDAALRRALSKEYGDTTSIIVTQRVSTIKNADAILVLDEGKAIGYGTHRELLSSCASYREIYEVQMGGTAR
ncbi:MAG: ABC transporter ATP-binding protein [Candidatus Izemoplasmatales bacterium]